MYSRHTTKWHTECMSHTAVCITQLLSMHNMHIIKRRKDYNQFKINMSCVSLYSRKLIQLIQKTVKFMDELHSRWRVR